ncbi:unnamed protein product [Darwinula stevensoni]|uniref:Uncharacterized protein n=1 Tax=Darwinula stevensoni TaxID=69355 RepID=A0A7R9AAR6_9CRUS|nr:unnamed protein product [Darwinula stevensoni]CAG0898557.1 unnamed protein product [Darwinula stevensoni]
MHSVHIKLSLAVSRVRKRDRKGASTFAMMNGPCLLASLVLLRAAAGLRGPNVCHRFDTLRELYATQFQP